MKKIAFILLSCIALFSCQKENKDVSTTKKSVASAISKNAMYSSIYSYCQFYPVNYDDQWHTVRGQSNPQPYPIATMHKADLFYLCQQQQCTTLYSSYKCWLRVNNSNTLVGPYAVTLTMVASQQTPGSYLNCLEASFYFAPLSWTDSYTLYLAEPAFTSGDLTTIQNYDYCAAGLTYNYRY